MSSPLFIGWQQMDYNFWIVPMRTGHLFLYPIILSGNIRTNIYYGGFFREGVDHIIQ